MGYTLNHFLAYNGMIKLDYIPMADQIADIFTKPLNSEKFRKFHDALGLVPVKMH